MCGCVCVERVSFVSRPLLVSSHHITVPHTHTHSSFPEEVNLHPFLAQTAGRDAPGHSNGHDFDGPLDESDNYKYTLFAVINHIGTMEQGHYTNYVRLASQEGQWFRCDDHVITLADRRTVLASQAYMLFYIKTRLEYRR